MKQGTIDPLIRAALPDDLDGIRDCARAAYALYVPRIGREPAPMVADFAARIAEGQVLVLEVAGRILGYAVAYSRGDHLHLENIAILPDRQGAGLGRRLIGHVEDQARGRGFVAVELYTNEKMAENLRFYPRIGYAEIDRRQEDGFSRVYFRKEL